MADERKSVNEDILSEDVIDKNDSDHTEQEDEKTDEKKFSQKDLDRILAERLSRNKQKQIEADKLIARQEKIETQERELAEKEKKLQCKEHLLKKGYPIQLLEIIDTNEPIEFMNKVDQVYKLLKPKPAPQRKSNDPEITKTFGFANQKHVPRNHPHYNYND